MPKVTGDLSSINAMSFSDKRYPFSLRPGNEVCEVDIDICSMPWFVVSRSSVVGFISISKTS